MAIYFIRVYKLSQEHKIVRTRGPCNFLLRVWPVIKWQFRQNIKGIMNVEQLGHLSRQCYSKLNFLSFSNRSV